jgi:teichoic acid transport system permease protein
LGDMKTIAYFKDLFASGGIVRSLALNDFRARYSGSYFGVAWGFVQPIVTILVYWFVFSVGLKASRPAGEAPFILWMTAGIVPWFFFSEAVSAATNCMQEYGYLVKKVVFRYSVLPTVKVISALIVHAFFILLLAVMFALYGYYPTVYFVQIPYYVLCACVLSLAVSVITSTVNVFFKDTKQIVAIALQLGFWATPIVWDISIIDIPAVSTVLRLNPVFYVVQGFRNVFVNHAWFFEQPLYTLYFWGVTLLLLWTGIRLFWRLKPHFSDVL